MIDLEIIFSVIIGGVLALLGSLLSNYLQYRSEKRREKKERIKEQYMEVRRYLVACLEFADVVSLPTTMGQSFGRDEYKDFVETITRLFNEWESLTINSSARILYVDDEKILQWLREIDQLKMQFYFNYRSLIDEGKMIEMEEKREKLKELALLVSSRLDELVDSI